jgi:hypothetical protein
MQCVIMLSQSLEFALVMCIAAHVMKAARSMRGATSSEQHLNLEEAFRIAIDRLTLEALRRVAAHLAIQGNPPRSRAQALEVIRAMPKLAGRLPSADEIASIHDAELREAVEILCTMWFVKYRNAVIHTGFRPTQTDAEFLYKHVPRLSQKLMRTFGVMRGQLVMPPRAGGFGARI